MPFSILFVSFLKEIDDWDIPSYCRKFEEHYPDASQIIKTLNSTSGPENEETLLRELSAEVTRIDGD